MAAADIDIYDHLPRIDGPQLCRFNEGRHKKIQYLKLLSDLAEDSSSPGSHGYVFSVLIDSKPYALKIFRFFSPEETRAALGPYENSRVSDEDIIGQTDPFYAECRAYGRIAEKKTQRKRPIAVPCHGFISIPAAKESFFAKKFNVSEWDRPEVELTLPLSKRQPFRALVKDLVEVDPEVTEKLIRSMLRELKALRSLKIYVMDVAARNYKGGHIVDFSSAWTEPYFEFRPDVRTQWEIEGFRRTDLEQFDEMVRKMGIKTSIRADHEPSAEVLSKLRPRKPKKR